MTTQHTDPLAALLQDINAAFYLTGEQTRALTDIFRARVLPLAEAAQAVYEALESNDVSPKHALGMFGLIGALGPALATLTAEPGMDATLVRRETRGN